MLLNFALDSIIFQCFPFAQNQYPKYTQHYVLCPELAQKHLQKKKAHHQPLSRYNPNALVNNCVGFGLSPFYGTQKVVVYDYLM